MLETAEKSEELIPMSANHPDLTAVILIQVLRDYFTGGLCGTSVDGHPIAIERTYSPDFSIVSMLF